MNKYLVLAAGLLMHGIAIPENSIKIACTFQVSNQKLTGISTAQPLPITLAGSITGELTENEVSVIKQVLKKLVIELQVLHPNNEAFTNKTPDSASDELPSGRTIINGRLYTKHALERMAKPTENVLSQLTLRAQERGYVPNSVQFNKYVQPRNVSAQVVEEVIQKGVKVPGNRPDTFKYEYNNIRVITSQQGGVITVIPLGKRVVAQ